MKTLCIALLYAAGMASSLAAEVTGTWRAVFTSPVSELPLGVGEMIFDLNAVEGKLTGMAHMGSWPGDAPLRDGKIEGDHISFTVIGKNPWTSRSANGEASGLPKLIFTGTIQGEQMQLTVMWDSAMLYGATPARVRRYEMSGQKATTGQ